jgi:hypothetical protein
MAPLINLRMPGQRYPAPVLCTLRAASKIHRRTVNPASYI